MSLARAWRRQLYGVSSVALIVPSAMLAAVIVLALGGGFGQVGILGQIFAGPPAPSAAGGGPAGLGPAAVGRSLPAIPVAALQPSTRPRGHRVVPAAPVRSGSGRGGGAPAPVGRAQPIVASGGSTPVPPRPAPSGSGSGSGSSPPAPQPGPSPQPTVVDQVVTPVTQQLPAPAGPAVTQAVQAAGSTADGLLPPGVGSVVPTYGLKLP